MPARAPAWLSLLACSASLGPTANQTTRPCRDHSLRQAGTGVRPATAGQRATLLGVDGRCRQKEKMGKSSVKRLIKTLVIAGALSVSAGVDVAAIEDLPCYHTKCVFNVLLNKSATEQMRGFCKGVSMDGSNSSMDCHPVKGMTCTSPEFKSKNDDYWACTCTNWSATKKQTATIDVFCPAPSDKRQ